MTDDPQIVVSPRAVYHMRQEILRLLDAERPETGGTLPPAELERLAGEWMRKYRTMRPESACLLVERLSAESAPEPGRFALFVLEGLERRYTSSLWPRVASLHAAVPASDLKQMLARRVVVPLLVRQPEILDTLESSPGPVDGAEALLLAEAARAMQVTAPELVPRVEAILARE